MTAVRQFGAELRFHRFRGLRIRRLRGPRFRARRARAQLGTLTGACLDEVTLKIQYYCVGCRGWRDGRRRVCRRAKKVSVLRERRLRERRLRAALTRSEEGLLSGRDQPSGPLGPDGASGLGCPKVLSRREWSTLDAVDLNRLISEGFTFPPVGGQKGFYSRDGRIYLVRRPAQNDWLKKSCEWLGSPEEGRLRAEALR